MLGVIHQTDFRVILTEQMNQSIILLLIPLGIIIIIFLFAHLETLAYMFLCRWGFQYSIESMTRVPNASKLSHRDMGP